MSFCPTCKRTYPANTYRCPLDDTLLRSGAASIEATQSLHVSPSRSASGRSGAQIAISGTEDIGYHAPITGPAQETSAQSPAARDKLATGSSREQLTSNERPGTSQRQRRHTTEAADRIGMELGKYRLVDLIGRGGMGCVYSAEHVKLGRPVALKLLHTAHAERRDAVGRFFQEARAVNRIRHRNIVDVTDFVELDDGTTFIIMELLEGSSLRQIIRRGSLDAPRILAMMIQICDGLAAAHRAGIVHRDLKPDNIFIVPTGEGGELVKLLDFGVAKLLNHDQDDNFGFETAAGAVIGTPAYMSPEQAGGLAVDARADIYSMGAIMYELFTGRPPFRGKSFGEFVRKHLSDMPIPPSQTPGGEAIDPDIEALVLHCLQKQPDARIQSATQLKAELMGMLADAETSTSMISAGNILASGDTPQTVMAGDVVGADSSIQPRSNWGLMIALAGVAFLAAVVIVMFVSRSGSHVDTHGAASGSPRKGVSTAPPKNIETDHKSHTSNPTVEPIVRDVPTNHITVRFDSTPRAMVYRANKPTSICHTPCDVTINTLDGDSKVSRNFLLRAAGHRDEPVTVHLTNAKPQRHIVLAPLRSRTRSSRAARSKRQDKTPAIVKPSTDSPKTTPREIVNKSKDTNNVDTSVDTNVDSTTTIDPFSAK